MTRLRESIEKNYQWLSSLAILFAFIIDSMTLVRVDLYLTNLLLLLYLTIAGVGIVIINLHEDRGLRIMPEESYGWLFIAMQFSFGGLFGRFLIYYGRSGSLLTSWPFLLILAGLLIGNELSRKRKYYTRLILQISFFFLALFSYLIFLIPVLLGRMGDDVFLLSGGVSLLIIAAVIKLLSRIVPDRVNNKSRALFASVGFIFALINLLYFTNIIPPIPLSLREAGAYHSVTPTDNGYIVTHEQVGSLDFLMPYKTLHIIPGEPLYVYTAVFAPTNFDTSIVHNWQIYNTETGKWDSLSKVILPIIGGRDNGYRGYSIKTRLSPGFWRVVIETLRGQAIGALRFKIEYADQEPTLINETL